MLQRGGDIRVDETSYFGNWELEPGPTQCLSMAIEHAARNGHVRVVRLLLDHQASALNMRSGYNTWPLLRAAGNDHAEVVKVLLEHSANIPSNAITDLGFGPPRPFDFSSVLHEVLKEGREEIVKILLADDRVKLDDQSWLLPLEVGMRPSLSYVFMKHLHV